MDEMDLKTYEVPVKTEAGSWAKGNFNGGGARKYHFVSNATKQSLCCHHSRAMAIQFSFHAPPDMHGLAMEKCCHGCLGRVAIKGLVPIGKRHTIEGFLAGIRGGIYGK